MVNESTHAQDISFPLEPISCSVNAFGVVRVPFDGIADLRKSPGARPPGIERIPHSLLKHADHQTLLALAALLKAAEDFGLEGPFQDWGVIAAPRFLGRVGIAGPFLKFQRSGASVVSPLIIPTMSLHAVAGSLSLAIKARGFHFGVGGGPGHLAEALTAGLASLDEPGVPGIWVVATGFDPEPIPDLTGNVLASATGFGVALAISAGRETPGASMTLRLNPGAATVKATGPASDAQGGEPLTPLIALADFLTEARGARGPRRWQCQVPGVGALTLAEGKANAQARRAG